MRGHSLPLMLHSLSDDSPGVASLSLSAQPQLLGHGCLSKPGMVTHTPNPNKPSTGTGRPRV